LGGSDSLEAEVAKVRISAVIGSTQKLLDQRDFLREERRRLRVANDFIELRKKTIATLKRSDWMPSGVADFQDQRRLRFNIGGFMFEVAESTLKRDATSLFAELCNDPPPQAPDSNGIFVFDRNWWVFRYILYFLRDGALPDDRELLAQMYKEAMFWKLTQLRIAIEEEKLHLREAPKDATDWWRTQPSYFKAIDEKKPDPPPPPAPAPPEDWWKASSYKGKVFGPLSVDPEKITTKAGEKDERPSTITTWEVPTVAPEKKAEEPAKPASLFFTG